MYNGMHLDTRIRAMQQQGGATYGSSYGAFAAQPRVSRPPLSHRPGIGRLQLNIPSYGGYTERFDQLEHTGRVRNLDYLLEFGRDPTGGLYQ